MPKNQHETIDLNEDEELVDSAVKFICERCKRKAEEDPDNADAYEFTAEDVEGTNGLCPNCSGPLKKIDQSDDLNEEFDDDVLEDDLEEGDLDDDIVSKKEGWEEEEE